MFQRRMEKKEVALKPSSLQEEDLAKEEQKVLAEAKDTAKKKAAKGAEVLAAKAAEDAKKSKKAKEGVKLKEDSKLQGVEKLPVNPKAKPIQQFPPFQQNVTALIKQATEAQLAAALNRQTELINSLKGQQEQFMMQQTQRQDSLQKRVSTMIGALPVKPALVGNSQNQV